jgi:hypothetical protein
MAKTWEYNVVRLQPEWRTQEKLKQVLKEHLAADETEFLQIVPDSQYPEDWLLIYRTRERKPATYGTRSDARV